MKLQSRKNKILLIILLLIVDQKIPFAQGTWERLSSPTNENLSSVYFVDSLYGWAAGFSGTIIHTTNGGNNWVVQQSKTENNILDIFFLDRDLGWAVFWEVYNYPFGTYVLNTTDGGANWISFEQPEENIFSQCIIFLDSLNGWMGGKGTPFVKLPIVKTIDGGRTWRNAVIDSSNFSTLPVFDIKFYNDKYGYACGGAIDCCGIMWWTNNGGDYWYVIDTPAVARDPINQLYLIDSIQVLGVGGDFESLGYGVEMIRTSDGGLNWDFNHIGIAGAAWDIDFRNENEAWAPLGGEQKLIYSLDSGKTWLQIFSPDSVSIFKLTFTDSLHGFGVGLDGAIIKYKPNVSSVKEDVVFIPERFVLQQNYPNPFNSMTKIGFRISNIEFVSLKIFDVLGNEVATLVDEELTAGSYEINFNAGQLPSGVYFYTFSVSGFLNSKKMVLLK